MWRLSIILASLWWGLGSSSAVQLEDLSLLMGPSFSPPDPAAAPIMDDAWSARSIEHESIYGDADLVLKLDQQMYPLLKSVVAEYAQNSGLKIAYVEGTCGIAAGGLKNKNSDIVGFCCPAAPIDRFPGIQFHTIGISPVAFLVNRNNPIDDLTLDELRGIYSGELYDWSQTADGEAKGFSGAITAVTRLHCKVRPGHWKLLIGKEDDYSPLINDVGAIPDVMQQVRSDLKAIGYADPDQVHQYATSKDVKIITVNGISVEDPESITHKHYPVYRVHSLTTWESGTAASKALVSYLLNQVNQTRYRYMTPTRALRTAGWKFLNEEIIGEPAEYR